MNAVRVLVEVVLVIILMILAFTQLVIPLWNGRPIFPLFKKRRKLERELGEANEEADNIRTEERLTAQRAKNQARQGRVNQSNSEGK